MPHVVKLPAKTIHECFTSLSLVAAKGSQLTPVSLSIKDSKLSFICLQGCVVQCAVTIPETDSVEIVFMYYDVTPLIHQSGDVLLTVSDYDVSITGDSFECSFPLGYSEVAEYDFSQCQFSKIEKGDYVTGLKTMLGMNLDKYYGQARPIDVYGDVSVIKHSCCYVQARTLGLPFSAQLDPEHVKMVTRFCPWEVSESIPDTLVFRRKNSILQIPCRSDIGKSNIADFLKDMQPKCQLTLGSAYDRLREASKVSNKSKCEITGTSTGMQIRITIENANSSIIIGSMDGDLQFVYNFPIQILLTFFKALGSGPIEILTGGDLLCMRSQSLIILVRAEY